MDGPTLQPPLSSSKPGSRQVLAWLLRLGWPRLMQVNLCQRGNQTIHIARNAGVGPPLSRLQLAWSAPGDLLVSTPLPSYTRRFKCANVSKEVLNQIPCDPTDTQTRGI